MSQASPFMPVDSSSLSNRPMSSRRKFGSGPLNALWGGLVLIDSAQYKLQSSFDYVGGGAILASNPIPLPYAQNLTFVAYWRWTASDGSFFLDSRDWDLTVEASPRQSLGTFRGQEIFIPFEPDSGLWQRLSAFVPGLTAGRDNLITIAELGTYQTATDVIKAFSVEATQLSGQVSSGFPFLRARLTNYNPSLKLNQAAELVVESWAVNVVWNSEQNPYRAGYRADHTLPADKFWNEQGLREGGLIRENTSQSTDRQSNVFGSKDR